MQLRSQPLNLMSHSQTTLFPTQFGAKRIFFMVNKYLKIALLHKNEILLKAGMAIRQKNRQIRIPEFLADF